MTEADDVAISWDDGVVVASLHGEIDIVNAADVAQQLDAGVAGARSVIVDLTSVGFMDSQGIAMLDRLSGRLEGEGRGLAIVAPPAGPPRRVLEIVDLGIPLYDDRDAARTALSARAIGSWNGSAGGVAAPPPLADPSGSI